MTSNVKSKPLMAKRETQPRAFGRQPLLDAKPKGWNGVQSILVPCDFSEASKAALRYAAEIAQAHKATISLIHVIELEYYNCLSYLVLSRSALTFVEAAASRLARIIRAEVPCSVAVRPLVQIGSPFEEIARAARALEADWIIIAAHGCSGFEHNSLGSTAERVVRYAPCPVLVTRISEVQKQKGVL